MATGAKRIPVVLLEGRTRERRRPATMLLAGHEPWISYLPERFFGETPTRRAIGVFPVWQLPGVIEAHGTGADLVTIRIDPVSGRRWLSDPAFLAVPEWIGTRIRVPADIEPLLRSGGSIKRDMSLIRQGGFESSCDDHGEALDYFYHRVYRPYTQCRYGEETYLRSLSDLRQRLRRGGLLWVEQDGRRVAGAFFERDGEVLSVLALGVIDGEFGLVQRGAVAALYYFALQLAQRVDCSTIDLRGCRPSLADGVLAYKKKWGAEVCEKPESYYDLMVRWNRPSAVVREFLAHTPLVFREAGGFSAITGDRAERSQSLQMKGIQAIYRLSDEGRTRVTDA